jgi:hypothetical protein
MHHFHRCGRSPLRTRSSGSIGVALIQGWKDRDQYQCVNAGEQNMREFLARVDSGQEGQDYEKAFHIHVYINPVSRLNFGRNRSI